MTQQALPLSALVEAAKSQGWEFIDDLEKAALKPPAKAENSADRIWAEALARVLDTDDGQTVMEGLLDRTLRRASWSYQLGMDPMQIAMQGVMREGQNAVVYMMLQAAARGREQQPQPPRD